MTDPAFLGIWSFHLLKLQAEAVMARTSTSAYAANNIKNSFGGFAKDMKSFIF